VSIPSNTTTTAQRSEPSGTGSLTDKQLKFARALVRELGIDDETLSASLQREYGVARIGDLGRTDGRQLIDRLVAKRDALAAGR